MELLLVSIAYIYFFAISLVNRSHVNFGLFSPEQMQQYAHIHCVSKNLYNQDSGRTPIPFGVLDSHMVCARFITRQFMLENNYYFFSNQVNLKEAYLQG